MTDIIEDVKKEVLEDVKTIASQPKKIASWWVEEVRWFVRVVISALDRFYWDNGFSRSASLAYTSLVSLVPFLAFGFGMLAAFASTKEYIGQVENYLVHKFVPAPEVAEQIVLYVGDFSNKISAITTPMIAFLVITSLLMVNSIEAALNETWQVFEPRPIAQRLSIFCAIVLIVPVFALSVYVFIELRIRPFLAGMEITYLDTLYNYLVPFFLLFGAFVFLYYLVPKAHVKFKSAVFGAFLTSVVFLVAYGAFAIYIEHASYNALYGTLAAIPIFLVWLYIFWTIVLVGAETTYQAQHLPRTGKVWKRSIHSVGDGRMLLAVQALVIVTKAFLDGEKMLSDTELSEQLGCSTVVLKPALDTLEKAQIVSRGTTPQKPVTLMCSPDKITLQQINEVLFKGRPSMRFSSEMRKMYEHFSDGRDGSSVTLVDIVNEDGK